MHFIVFILLLLNIGRLKTESDYLPFNNDLDIFPYLHKSKKDIEIVPPYPEYKNENKKNDIVLMIQPDRYRQDIDWNDYEDLESLLFDYEKNKYKTLEQLDELEVKSLFKRLSKLLQDPDIWEPLFIKRNNFRNNISAKKLPNKIDEYKNIVKKSRYYRRYPWKRQNYRSPKIGEYDPDCNPTRDDVFQLLVALHDARQGKKSRFVNICNRRRPAGAIFTNIRFLGRKRK